ncbi:MAG: universal stress protein [Dehalococcoidia bacterium]
MYKTILVALDGSALAEHSLPHATALAKAFEARIHLVRVFDVQSLAAGAMPLADPAFAAAGATAQLYEQALEAERETVSEYLSGVAARLKPEGATVEYSVQQGAAAEIIAALAEELPADLVVLTSRGQGGFKRFIFGSVTEDVIRKVEKPVLVVPNQED